MEEEETVAGEQHYRTSTQPLRTYCTHRYTQLSQDPTTMQSARLEGDYLDHNVGHEGDPSYMNVEEGAYDYIDADVVVPKDGHQYEQLRHMGRTSGEASPEQNSRRQQPDPAQQSASADGTQSSKNCCRRPACWRWAVLITILLIIAATLIALLVTSSTDTGDMTTSTTNTASLPARGDTTTATGDSTVGTTATIPASTAILTTAIPIPTPKACQDVYNNGGRTSGVYTISADGVNDVQVYCEQQLQGGGWTVFQRRINGTIDFNRVWDDYKRGFGHAAGEYWFGNDHLHQLTVNRDTQLLVELERGGETQYAPYTEFWVLSERMNYTLHVVGYTGGSLPGDSLQHRTSWGNHNGMAFTTRDRDNDKYSGGNCANSHYGGWWYIACYWANLNGRYDTGIQWLTWGTGSLSATRMMLKTK